MNNDWKLLFVLPNLHIRNPIESTNLVLIPPTDERLDKIKQEDIASQALLTKFSTQFGNGVKPCAILLNTKAPEYYKQMYMIVDFRNTVAISAIIEGYTCALERGQSLEPMYSDFFDLYPITPNISGNKLTVHTPIVLGGSNDPEKFFGQISPLISFTNFNTPSFDENLLGLLLRLWEKDPQRKSWKVRAIFRSLQIAYQALSAPYANPFSEFDYGTRIALWISAFEALIHPGGKKEIGIHNILDALGSISFSNPRLKSRLYRYKDRSVNFIQKLYSQLYSSRNAFLHGNPIKDEHIYPFGNRTKKILPTFVPLIYKAVLVGQLWNTGVRKKRRGRIPLSEKVVDRINHIDFENVLLKAL